MRRDKYLLVVLLLEMFVLQSFKTYDLVDGKPLVVERQECVLQSSKHKITGEPFGIGVVIDAPVEGEKVLVSAVISFLNESLYKFFEAEQDENLAYDAVFSTDSRRLLPHYQQAYRERYENDSTYFISHFLEVVMLDQTDNYITYGIFRSFEGEGVATDQEWITFKKHDGSRLGEIISDKDLFLFLKEHPEQRDMNIWEDMKHRQKEGYTFNENLGLMNDSVVHQHCYAPGIFETTKYDMRIILPYLSKEAQNLVTGN